MSECAYSAAERLAEDARARSQALLSGSFIVEAPAGAGKTELLTQRFLARLAEVAVPEEVVALTFTNKAAAEMRERILNSLDLVDKTPRATLPPHRQVTFDLARRVLAQDVAYGWNLRGNPGRLMVTTLDALCMGLVRQMPLLSRFGAEPRITNNPEIHYEAAARATLALLEGDDATADLIAAALTEFDNDAGKLTRLLVAMLERRDQWLPHGLAHVAGDSGALRKEAETGLRVMILRDLNGVTRFWDAATQTALMASLRYAASQPNGPTDLINWRVPLSAGLEDLPSWRALADVALTQSGDLRKALNVRNGFPATPEGKGYKADCQAVFDAMPQAAAVALARVRQLPEPVYATAEWSTVDVFARLLHLAAGQLWLIFCQAGEVDFSEISQRARQALGDDEAPTDLALALDRRISHLLIDEFQDTSPLQVRLLEALMRGWQADELADGRRSLFLVGDPMQSIYRFRKADVGLFLQVRDAGIKPVRLTSLRLYRNNRSDPAIVDWVNRIFPAIFPPLDEPLAGAVRYADAATDRVGIAGAGVQIHAAASVDDEAAAILNLIRDQQRLQPEIRIAVLVRARAHLAVLAQALRQAPPEAKVAVQAVEIDALAERQAIQDLLSLTHALMHRADRVHWLAILRAPWCGLTLNDLHVLAGDDHVRTLWQLLNDAERMARLSVDGQVRAVRLRAILAVAFAHEGRMPMRRWIESVWRQLGGPLCAPDAEADCRAFFALIDRLVAADELTPEIIEARTAELFAASETSADSQYVQLMTIHKAKGLEFDLVILPGLDRAMRNPDSDLLVWESVPVSGQTGECLVAAAWLSTSARVAGPTLYAYLNDLEKERGRHESERLLYVAATRARTALHLFAVLDPAARRPKSGSFLERLWEGPVGTEFRAQVEEWAPVEAGSVMTVEQPPSVLLRLPLAALPPASFEVKAMPGGKVGPKMIAESLEMLVGTLVHRGLELISKSDAATWDVARVRRLQSAYWLWLEQAGQPVMEAKVGAVRVVEALCRVLESERGRWLLAPHTQAGAEEAWMFDGPDGPVQRVIDRTFIADGYRWIIDYKIMQGTNLNLLAVADTYRDQLTKYADLYRDAGFPIRTAIFFCLQGEWVELGM